MTPSGRLRAEILGYPTPQNIAPSSAPNALQLTPGLIHDHTTAGAMLIRTRVMAGHLGAFWGLLQGVRPFEATKHTMHPI